MSKQSLSVFESVVHKSRQMSKPTQSLATGRERRANAGTKMAALLDREEVVDEFYTTTYGGFVEEAEDNDYDSDDSSDSGDEIDSDFDIDENDEPVSDDNEDDERKRRPKRKSVYTEPKPEAKKVAKPAESPRKAESSGQSRPSRRPPQSESTVTPFRPRVSPKKFRESTRRNARETEHRLRVAQKESEKRRKIGQKNDNEYRQLTQAEMLREAKKTEQINLKSLERYRKLELEKSKKSKVVKEAPKGPFVRYQSVTMPLIEEIDSEEQNKQVACGESASKCARTFVSFTDEQTFRQYFPERKPPQPKPKLFCPISHLPGRYFDPVSLLPYSSAPTFRAIREAYYKQLEQLGDQRQPEVAKWVQWRKKTSQQRPNIQPRIIRIIK